MIADVATLRKLEIGPKPDRLGPDWTTVDAEKRDYVDHVALWGWAPLPLPDASFDLFYASHVIEHIPWWRASFALSDAFRILAPGGTIELHTIDFEVVVRAYVSRCAVDKWKGILEHDDPHPMASISGRLFAYGSTLGDPQWHHACFDADYLAYLLEKAGFLSPERVKEPRGNDKHGVVNLGMKAVKP